MAEANPVSTKAVKEAPAFMQVVIYGRIEGSSLFQGVRETKIMTPAQDEFSRPQLLQVRSRGRIGEKGEMVTIRCLLGGYQRKAYQAKDKDTGETKTVVPVEHTLDLIED